MSPAPLENQYSSAWFQLFLEQVRPERTQAEVEFLARNLPLPSYRTVLDLCCGNGRHALGLAARGYQVSGVDRDRDAIRKARGAMAPQTSFHVGDVRNLSGLNDRWSAATILWSSFGYFTPAENLQLLTSIRDRLHPGGRLILDVYNREYFEQRQGESVYDRGGTHVTEKRWLEWDRLRVDLSYAGAPGHDRFSWQVFTAPELASFVRATGFELLLACANFDESCAINADSIRMQLVFQLPGEIPQPAAPTR